MRQLLCVAEAYTPVVKFKLLGVSIDMLFASLPKVVRAKVARRKGLLATLPSLAAIPRDP